MRVSKRPSNVKKHTWIARWRGLARMRNRLLPAKHVSRMIATSSTQVGEGQWRKHEQVENDASVECQTRSIVEDGESIWPERFPSKRVDQLRREFGSMFYLLYMNSVGDPELVDFDIELVREFKYVQDGEALEFLEDAQDGFLVKKLKDKGSAVDQMPSLRGMKLDKDTWSLVFAGMEKGRGEFFKYREGPVRLRG